MKLQVFLKHRYPGKKIAEYNHLVSITKAKALLLEYGKTEDDDKYICEKDVENKLIKPLIEKLSYKEGEYEQ